MRTYCALALAGGVGASAQYVNATNSTSGYIHYETVTGYFLQDEPYTDPETFDYVRNSPSSFELMVLMQIMDGLQLRSDESHLLRS